MSKMLKITAAVVAPAMALSMMAAPASAQSYRHYDRDRGDNTTQNALIGAAVGGIAGALLGNGDGTYIAGGALAGAALGAVAWQLWRIIKRIDRHAQSIAHMDEWADVVDQSLTRIEERTRRTPSPAAPAPRSAVDFKKWGQK